MQLSTHFVVRTRLAHTQNTSNATNHRTQPPPRLPTAFKPQQQQPPKSSWKAHHCLCVRTWNVHMSSQKIALHIFITLKIIISIRFSIRMQSDSDGTCTRARTPRRVWLLTYGVAQKSEHLWAPPKHGANQVERHRERQGYGLGSVF